jgi:cold-inducible RNA-binding protein
MKLFVGNLSFGTTEDTVRSLFETQGTVDSVNIMTDRDTGRSRGFAFVEMPNDAEAQNAITAMSGKEVAGRALTVNQARPKEDRGFGRDSFRANGGGYRRTQSRW